MPPFSLTDTFTRFAKSEQSAGLLLLACTVVSLTLANSPLSDRYLDLWQIRLGPLSLEHWINDALMAVFFLFIGLELERELYVGELSRLRNALLPAFAAVGGMLAPALIHFVFNAGTATQQGFGIPMATDIAFALAVIALLGDRVPPALKVFVVAFAVIDDLGAIVLIAAVYSAEISAAWFGAAGVSFVALLALNRFFRVMRLWPYLLGGAVLWVCVLNAGIHASISGVLLANTGVPIDSQSLRLADPNNLGVALGLLIGKPVGVVALCLLAVTCKLSSLPDGVGWRHVIGAGLLGGIGFTMSIFITNLAFAGSEELVNSSKLAVLTASLLAGVAGWAWLRAAAQLPRKTVVS
jgi:Na+:H+ antiporter, NhaA family